MDNQMTIDTISDKVYDDVVIYKLFSNPTLLESLKKIENVEVFTAIKEIYINKLKVCIFYYYSKSITQFWNLKLILLQKELKIKVYIFLFKI